MRTGQLAKMQNLTSGGQTGPIILDWSGRRSSEPIASPHFFREAARRGESVQRAVNEAQSHPSAVAASRGNIGHCYWSIGISSICIRDASVGRFFCGVLLPLDGIYPSPSISGGKEGRPTKMHVGGGIW